MTNIVRDSLQREVVQPSEQEAINASIAAGYVVAQIVPDAAPIPYAGKTCLACALDAAEQLAVEHRGLRFGVFKLARDFVVEPT